MSGPCSPNSFEVTRRPDITHRKEHNNDTNTLGQRARNWEANECAYAESVIECGQDYRYECDRPSYTDERAEVDALAYLRDDRIIVLHDCNLANASIACPSTSCADFRAQHR